MRITPQTSKLIFLYSEKPLLLLLLMLCLFSGLSTSLSACAMSAMIAREGYTLDDFPRQGQAGVYWEYNDPWDYFGFVMANSAEYSNAERLATEIALTNAHRPNANIVFPTLDEFHLGEFIMMFEIQTVFTGKLLHIDPLDQPGVEAGKIATYALMGKAGFDKERAEIKEYLDKRES